jgi:hypothetical protein
LLLDLSVGNGSTPYAGDTKLLTTISPNGDGFRDEAHVHFRLPAAATVTMQVTETVKVPTVVYARTDTFGPGAHTMTWSPRPGLDPRTYLVRMIVRNAHGRTVYGAPNAFTNRYPRAPVVRLQGIDATFLQQSYVAGGLARLRISTDEPSLQLRLYQAGPEHIQTFADDQLNGVELDEPPVEIPWETWRSTPHALNVRVPDVPSGLYFAELQGPDGRVGYAPFVVRPTVFGATSRVLVVLPTNTWEAYDFQDVDGDGYGDTWYAGPPNRYVDLTRPYLFRGVPPHYAHYDLGFLHWLYWSGKQAEFISDSDFDAIESGNDLARAYDLVVFEGHEEYVTPHEYDVVQRFRDLGGNLMFLSADNFMWQVRKTGHVLEKIGEWRQDGRPEAALIGVEYRANDNGRRQGDFVLQNTAAVPWLWAGTGLTDGSLLGEYVGGYGIEIDSTAPQSPPGTIVLAQIPNLYGPGLTAQMSYYELPNGAKVFAAGALDFGGSSSTWPVKHMLDNLWAKLAVP